MQKTYNLEILHYNIKLVFVYRYTFYLFIYFTSNLPVPAVSFAFNTVEGRPISYLALDLVLQFPRGH